MLFKVPRRALGRKWGRTLMARGMVAVMSACCVWRIAKELVSPGEDICIRLQAFNTSGQIFMVLVIVSKEHVL
jgi:hypothetical protein